MRSLAMMILMSFAVSACAISVKHSDASRVKTKKEGSYLAFAISSRGVDEAGVSHVSLRSRKQYELALKGAPTLYTPGANIYVVELPPGQYMIDGFSAGPKHFETSLSGPSRIVDVKPGQISFVGKWDFQRMGTDLGFYFDDDNRGFRELGNEFLESHVVQAKVTTIQ